MSLLALHVESAWMSFLAGLFAGRFIESAVAVRHDTAFGASRDLVTESVVPVSGPDQDWRLVERATTAANSMDYSRE